MSLYMKLTLQMKPHRHNCRLCGQKRLIPEMFRPKQWPEPLPERLVWSVMPSLARCLISQ